jgi:hypothetical protein
MVVLERNAKRARSVPTSIVTNSWKAVQNNIGKFSNFFKGNFIILDNNDVDEDMMLQIFKRGRRLANKKVQNGRRVSLDLTTTSNEEACLKFNS